MQRTIAIGLSKGGTGKTSTAVNLAYGLTLRGRSVILVDCDEQGAAARALGVKPSAGLAQLIEGAPAADCLTEARPGLWLIAGGPALAATKRDIARRDIGAERVLSEALARVDTDGAIVILDTAPAIDAMLVNALWAADYILAPVQLEALAAIQITTFLDKAAQVATYRGADYRRVDILPTGLDRRIRQPGDILEQLREHFSGQVLDAIPTNVAISQAAAYGQAVAEYAPQSAGALAYAQLATFYNEVIT